ncbi:MAG TPA: tetratricopeptide repeat protein, partial [Verrucomicrobiae bacterium]|nr:tetratricopeptide repeat protein [Verrucomicrobiae bacterium]
FAENVESMKNPTSQVLEFGDFRLDLEERVLFRADGTTHVLTPRVFETLRYLVNHRGRVLDKERLMAAVWPDSIVEENNLAQNISSLRRIFGDTPASQRYIVTVPGRGYRFVADVRTTDANGAAEPGAEVVPEKASALPPRRWANRAAVGLAILVLGGAGFLLWHPQNSSQTSSRASSVPEKSIAVLPFENLSADKENAYFVAGVQDEILSNLAKIADLKVISRTSANLYKSGNPRNLREIGEQLGVAHLLEGSVQRADDRLRIHVQLIDARTDTHLWAQTYDRGVSDVFAIQGEIAQAVGQQLRARLTKSEKSAVTARPTSNFKAFEACLQGRYFWNKRTLEGYQEAIVHFRRAIEADPGYAEAYVGLADASAFLAFHDSSDLHETSEKVRALLHKALEIDPTLGEAHASLGLMAMNHDWDWGRAETEFRRAIELNPNYATAHQWYGEFLAYMGRFDDAIAEIIFAHQLDPLSAIINTDVGKVHHLARRYDDAVIHYQAALKIDPDFAQAHGLLGLVYAFQGKHREAVDELHKVKDWQNSSPYLAWLAHVHAIAGNQSEARQAIARLTELEQQSYVSPFWMAIAWTLLDKDETFKWFERIFAEHATGGAVTLKVNPLFDSLRSDPRFDDLLRRAFLK